MALTGAVRAAKRDPLLQMVKTALATILAWVVSDLLIPDGPPPVFAAIAAMLVVQPSLNQSLTKGVERSAGVVAGVVLATLLGMAFGDASWVVLVAVTAALVLSWALRLTTGSANQIAISALLVLALGASTPDYAFFRVIETGIGAVIGIVVHLLLVPPVRLDPARTAMAVLGEETAQALERLADALVSRKTRPGRLLLLADARRLHGWHDDALEALEDADDALHLNPRARRYRDELTAMRETLDLLTKVGSHIRGMTRAYIDHYDDEVREEPVVAGIAEELLRAAHDLRLRLQLAVPSFGYEHLEDTAPALTAPLDVSAPHGMRWILVGSLMEDLRRIRHELGAQSA
ncbi:FUSC family protein [Janibacter anophelis]|uniref:FUSC family protein n=1 Tax=Janibacter anophelis TaxID=319054 RepID=UPI000835F100|nr:FUSC family protein [Janibacter anophelis]